MLNGKPIRRWPLFFFSCFPETVGSLSPALNWRGLASPCLRSPHQLWTRCPCTPGAGRLAGAMAGASACGRHRV